MVFRLKKPVRVARREHLEHDEIQDDTGEDGQQEQRRAYFKGDFKISYYPAK